jgi:hypothetical protein
MTNEISRTNNRSSLDEAMRPLKILTHPIIVPQCLGFTKTTRGAHTEAHMISPAPAAPTPHVSPLPRMKSMLSRHKLHLTFGRWRNHYNIIAAQHNRPEHLILHRVADVLSILEHKVNVLVETLKGPTQSLASPHLDEDGLTYTTLKDPLNHLSQINDLLTYFPRRALIE